MSMLQLLASTDPEPDFELDKRFTCSQIRHDHLKLIYFGIGLAFAPWPYWKVLIIRVMQ